MKTIILLLMTSMVFAADWDKEYKELCSYDSRWCGRLKNSDGTFIRPKPEIIKLLKELRDPIEATAKRLGVDPKAIAGSIMAENSLNVSISDDVQNLLVRIGVAKKGEILGKKFTYGLGQLNFTAAREAENHVAALEKRPPISDEKLSDELLIPEKAIYYVGAVIKKVQDDYKKQNIDVSNRPEILTSLYNLGNSAARADETSKTGSTPRPNYFGFFVKKNLSELSFLKGEEPKVLSLAPAEVVAPTSARLPKVTSPKAASPVAPPKAEAKEMQLVLSKAMPLYQSPPTCKIHNDYGGTNLKDKYDKLTNYPVTTIGEKEASYTVIAPTIDCETNSWELIKLRNGETGWIKQEELEKNSKKLMLPKLKCSEKKAEQCLEAIKKGLGKQFVSYDSKGLLKARPYSVSENVDFKFQDWNCTERITSNQPPSAMPAGPAFGLGGFGGLGVKAPLIPLKTIPKDRIDPRLIQEELKHFDEKVSAIEKSSGLKVTDPKHPLYSLKLDGFRADINRCLDREKVGLRPCALTPEAMKSTIELMSAETKRDPVHIATLSTNLKLLRMGNSDLITPKEYAEFYDATKNTAGFNGVYSPTTAKVYGALMKASNFTAGSFGYQLAEWTPDDQYLYAEEEEEKWGLSEINTALQDCSSVLKNVEDIIKNDTKMTAAEKKNVTMNKSTLNQKVKKINKDLAKLMTEPNDVSAPIVKTYRPYLVTTIKMCHALVDMYNIDDNSLKSQSGHEYRCQYKGLDVLSNFNELMLKSVMKDIAMEPQYLNNAFMQIGHGIDIYDNNLTYEIQSLNPQGVPVMQYQPLAQSAYDDKIPPSYCPNKTAEQIEDLLKENSCIKRVYIPDSWLLSRLNALSSRVVYRPFESEEHYAFEIEGEECK